MRRRSRCRSRGWCRSPTRSPTTSAAALLLQGLTAHALVHRCARLEPGETVVVQAAGGGTGTLAVQLAKRAGGRVIALASTAEKRELAARLGADATVDSRAEDLKQAILEANDGERVDAVLEMTGGRPSRRACARWPRSGARGLRDRLPRAERGRDRPSAAPLPRRDRLLAHAPDPAARRGRGDDRRPVRRRRRGRARGRRRRRLPALGGAARARGPRRARHPGKLLLDPAR